MEIGRLKVDGEEVGVVGLMGKKEEWRRINSEIFQNNLEKF